MKKVFILVALFLLTGCTSSGEDVTCITDGKEEIYNIKDGLVNSLTIDGKKQSQSSVDELNGTYFTSAKDNDDLKSMIYDYVSGKGGTCN